MIFNPLFIDLESKQINTIGQKALKGSYLFRDIINLEETNSKERNFNTTNILSSLLTQVNNLSKEVDGNDSQLNGLLANFRISNSKLSKLNNSAFAFTNDAPLLVDSKEKLSQIITKSIEGLAAEFDLQITQDTGNKAKQGITNNNPIDAEELIKKLKELPGMNGQLNIVFFNPESNESFKLSIQKVVANDGYVDAGSKDNSSYLLSISAENFHYQDGNIPLIQKIIDANKTIELETEESDSNSEKLTKNVENSAEDMTTVAKNKINLDRIDSAIQSDVKNLLDEKNTKAEPVKKDLRKTQIDNDDIKENVIPKIEKGSKEKENKIIDEAPKEESRKTRLRTTLEWNDNDKILSSNKKLQAELQPETKTEKPQKTNFIDRINNSNKSASELELLSVGNSSTVKIKLVPKKEDGYEELKTKQLKNYFEGTEKVSDASKIKYSPLLEKLTIVSAKNLKDHSNNKQINPNSLNDEKPSTDPIKDAFKSSNVGLKDDVKIDLEVNKQDIQHVESKDHLSKGAFISDKINVEQLSKNQKVINTVNNNEDNVAIKNESKDESRIEHKVVDKQHVQKSDENTKDINVKEKAHADNSVKNESKDQSSADHQNRDEKTHQIRHEKSKDASEKGSVESARSNTVSKQEGDSAEVKQAHKAGEINTTNNQHNIFGKEIKVDNPTNDFSQTVKVNPKEQHQLQLNSKIVDEIKDMVVSDKKDKAIINLEPASLGKIKIMVELVENKLTARVDVENQAAKDMLQNQMQFLKESLNSGGIQLSSLNISHQNAEHKGARPDKEKRRDEEIHTVKNKKEISKDNSSKNLGYNTYEFLA